MAGLQIPLEVLPAPATDPRISVARKVVRPPAFGQAATKLVAVVEGLQRRARRMAVAAMSERFDQIGPAVPGQRTVRDGLETRVRVIQPRPDCHQPALVVRKPQLRLRWNVPLRRQTEQVGLSLI